MDRKDFKIRVKAELERKDMTQSELARELGITDTYLSDILRGNRKGGKYKELIGEKLGLMAE